MVHAVVDGARGYFQSGIEMCRLEEEIDWQVVMETRASSNVRGKGKTYTGYKKKENLKRKKRIGPTGLVD